MHARTPVVFVNYERIPFLDWRAMWFDYLGTHIEQLRAEVHRFTYQRIRDGNTTLRGFVATGTQPSGCVPLGFVHYYFHPSSYNLADACTIEDLYVRPEYRGAGVGRQLIDQVTRIASDAGAPALHWKATPSNLSAIALYRTLAAEADVLCFRKQL